MLEGEAKVKNWADRIIEFKENALARAVERAERRKVKKENLFKFAKMNRGLQRPFCQREKCEKLSALN